MQANRVPGRVLTFYSYKGGTGRSMCLANVAWILASSGKRVLMIDWDLEAPGLHRYFRPFLVDKELTASEGLIDLVDRYASQVTRPLAPGDAVDEEWHREYADLSDYVVSVKFDRFPREGCIDLLPAGRQSDRYAVLVNSFNWQNFFDRLGGGGFLEAVKDYARARYDYVLIDSRTGVSDTAGISSVQMPDTLVVCLTYNNQSIQGAAAVARSAIEMKRKLREEEIARQCSLAQRSASDAIGDSPPPYRVFPVPMRVVLAESDRLAMRQAYAQTMFRDLLGHLGGDIAEYWGHVEVPHISFYAYEEVLAPLKDSASDPKTLLAAVIRLTRYLTNAEVSDYVLPLSPQETRQYLDNFAAVNVPLAAGGDAWVKTESPEEALARSADLALQQLSDADQELARRVLLRLVRVGRADEGGGYFHINAQMSDFSREETGVAVRLSALGLLTISTHEQSYGSASASGEVSTEQGVSLADERLIRGWKRLAHWIESDKEFLLWRQQLRGDMRVWQRHGRAEDAFLTGPQLRDAEYWMQTRHGEINDAEREFIVNSGLVAQARLLEAQLSRASAAALEVAPALASWRTKWGVAAFVLLGALAGGAWFLFKGPSAPSPVASSAKEVPLPVVPAAPAPPVIAPPNDDKARSIASAMRLDIFWCESSGKSALVLAQQLRTNLAGEIPFKSVNVVQLKPEINAERGYAVSGLQVRPSRGSQDEIQVADALMRTEAAQSVASATGYAWRTVEVRQDSPDYLSVFVCPAGG